MKIIYTTSDTPVYVDDEDYKYLILFTWYDHSDGYVVTRHKNKVYFMHRLVMDAKKNEIIDHENHILTDNQKSNLRRATKSTNGMNSKKQKRKTSSKYKGVSYDGKRGLWRAYIKNGQKQISLGRHLNEKDAAKAYNKKARELFGEFAYLNEIEEEKQKCYRVKINL